MTTTEICRQPFGYVYEAIEREANVAELERSLIRANQRLERVYKHFKYFDKTVRKELHPKSYNEACVNVMIAVSEYVHKQHFLNREGFNNSTIRLVNFGLMMRICFFNDVQPESLKKINRLVLNKLAGEAWTSHCSKKGCHNGDQAGEAHLFDPQFEADTLELMEKYVVENFKDFYAGPSRENKWDDYPMSIEDIDRLLPKLEAAAASNNRESTLEESFFASFQEYTKDFEGRLRLDKSNPPSLDEVEAFVKTIASNITLLRELVGSEEPNEEGLYRMPGNIVDRYLEALEETMKYIKEKADEGCEEYKDKTRGIVVLAYLHSATQRDSKEEALAMLPEATRNNLYGFMWEEHCKQNRCHEGSEAGKLHCHDSKFDEDEGTDASFIKFNARTIAEPITGKPPFGDPKWRMPGALCDRLVTTLRGRPQG